MEIYTAKGALADIDLFDAAFFGIVGAMMSGVLSTAGAIGKPWKLPVIFTQAIKYSKALHQKAQ